MRLKTSGSKPVDRACNGDSGVGLKSCCILLLSPTDEWSLDVTLSFCRYKQINNDVTKY